MSLAQKVGQLLATRTPWVALSAVNSEVLPKSTSKNTRSGTVQCVSRKVRQQFWAVFLHVSTWRRQPCGCPHWETTDAVRRAVAELRSAAFLGHSKLFLLYLDIRRVVGWTGEKFPTCRINHSTSSRHMRNALSLDTL